MVKSLHFIQKGGTSLFVKIAFAAYANEEPKFHLKKLRCD